jgi:nicotinamide mononucleotide adenylyltransferase
MKTRSFEVSADMMPEFAEILGNNNLDNDIQGINDDNDILVDVYYESEEREAVMELMLLLDPDDEDGIEEDED